MAADNTPQLRDPLIGKPQVAELLGMTQRSLERWIATGAFPAPMRLGKRGFRRWRLSTVERFLDKLEKQAEAETAQARA